MIYTKAYYDNLKNKVETLEQEHIANRSVEGYWESVKVPSDMGRFRAYCKILLGEVSNLLAEIEILKSKAEAVHHGD